MFRCLTQHYKRPRSIFILFIIRLVNGSCSVAPFLLLVGQWRAGGCGRIKTIISFIYDKTCRHFHVYSRACKCVWVCHMQANIMVIVLLILWSTHRGRWSHNNPIICHTAEGIHLQRTDAQHTAHAEAWRRTGNESINYMCNVCVLCVCVLRVSSIIFFLYFSLGCVVCVETCVCMMFHFFRYFIFFSSPHTFVRAPFMQAIPIDAYTCEAEKKKLYGIIKTNRNDVCTFFSSFTPSVRMDFSATHDKEAKWWYCTT